MSSLLPINLLVLITLISGFLVVYHHLGYPLLLRLLSKREVSNKMQEQPQRHYTDSPKDKQLAEIAIVMPAYNEAQWIAEKIRVNQCVCLTFLKFEIKVKVILF